VLTPAHRPVGEYLEELHASLDGQEGVEWEWVLQLDGDDELHQHIPDAIRRDGRVAIEANGRWLGQSVTRNLALVRTRHQLLQTVDADDVLEPGALAAAASALEADGEAALAFGRTREIGVDGRLVEGKNLYPPGRVAPGTFARDWERRGGSCSVVMPSIMWRTAVVDAACGWPAAVAGMDVLLLLAVTSRHPALSLERYTYRYRQHPDQVHRSALRHEMRPRYRALARRMLAQLGDGAGPRPPRSG
jgi:glycosyltransferase involved in cell wall biosynthesis